MGSAKLIALRFELIRWEPSDISRIVTGQQRQCDRCRSRFENIAIARFANLIKISSEFRQDEVVDKSDHIRSRIPGIGKEREYNMMHFNRKVATTPNLRSDAASGNRRDWVWQPQPETIATEKYRIGSLEFDPAAATLRR